MSKPLGRGVVMVDRQVLESSTLIPWLILVFCTVFGAAVWIFLIGKFGAAKWVGALGAFITGLGLEASLMKATWQLEAMLEASGGCVVD